MMTRSIEWGAAKSRPRVAPTHIIVTVRRLAKAGWEQVIGSQMVRSEDLDAYIASVRRIYKGPADLLVTADYDYTVAVEEPMSPYYG